MSRTLQATIEVAAPPARVWEVLADLRRMPEFSPQCIRMIPLGRPRAGTFTVNLNRDGKYMFWPTSSRIVAYEPGKSLAFRMNENRTIWSFELAESDNGGTVVTQQRKDSGNGVPAPIRKAIDIGFKGESAFDATLVAGMNTTLSRLKAAAER